MPAAIPINAPGNHPHRRNPALGELTFTYGAPLVKLCQGNARSIQELPLEATLNWRSGTPPWGCRWLNTAGLGWHCHRNHCCPPNSCPWSRQSACASKSSELGPCTAAVDVDGEPRHPRPSPGLPFDTEDHLACAPESPAGNEQPDIAVRMGGRVEPVPGSPERVDLQVAHPAHRNPIRWDARSADRCLTGNCERRLRQPTDRQQYLTSPASPARTARQRPGSSSPGGARRGFCACPCSPPGWPQHASPPPGRSTAPRC